MVIQMTAKKRDHLEAQLKWKNKNLSYFGRWRKSFGGYFKYTYSQIKGRCTSPSKPLYFGMDFMPKSDWIIFLKDTKDERFRLFKQWVNNNYSMRFAPSIDRIDGKKGYLIDNCRWLTQSENARIALTGLKRVKK